VKADVAVVILTFNEEKNVGHALDSVCGWAKQVFVFDSFSTDGTLDVARRRPCQIAQHRFESFGRQRNAALELLPVTTEWILFLDADEWLTDELKREISTVIDSAPTENGFYIKRRLIWEGAWIKRGYYPTWILRLFRRGHGRCEDRAVNEHIVLDGDVGRLDHDFMHEDRNGVSRWIEKHNGYATREAEALFPNADGGEISATPWGSQAERKRWIKLRVWNRLPPLLRPLVYFSYRYVLRGGVLDGSAGFTYHFMQALWFQTLIDLKFLEMKRERPVATNGAAVTTHVGDEVT
jgi:glycosyltransferase involved in cell wall biosynthesis